jgi:hypothetical protein
VGVDVANHVREFLANADMGVRMKGGGKDGVNPLRMLVDQGGNNERNMMKKKKEKKEKKKKKSAMLAQCLRDACVMHA